MKLEVDKYTSDENDKISTQKEELELYKKEELLRINDKKIETMKQLEVQRKDALEGLELDLHQFTKEYLDQNYVERRDEVLLEQLGYTPIEYRYSVSEEYREKIKYVEQKEISLIKQGNFVCGHTFGKKSDTAKFEKMITSGFNAITDSEISKVSIKNYEQKKKKIETEFTKYDNALKVINKDLFIAKLVKQYKLRKLSLMLEYKQLVEEEKELLKEQRLQEKEDKKIQDAINKEIAKIESEKKKIETQKQVYIDKLENVEDDSIKEALLKEVEELKAALEGLNSNEKTLEEKRNLTRAGYVYVISNVGSFGENVYKIGLTRRDKPEERILELGNASVPFKFDTHALIYSKNAYELESKLHNEFDSKRVNLVNRRKEFFNVSLEDIKKVVLENYNGTVDFISTPEAIEYRETLIQLNDNNK